MLISIPNRKISSESGLGERTI